MRTSRVLLSVSCLLMGMGISTILIEPEVFQCQVYAQSNKLTSEQLETVQIIKNNLAGIEPINLEQLLSVPDDVLLEQYNELSKTMTGNELWQAMYQYIAQHYPELQLLTGDGYVRYKQIAQDIVARTEYSISDLNTALPSDIVSWYDASMANHDQNIDEAVNDIKPLIQQARDNYFERKRAREAVATENNTESEATQENSVDTIRNELIAKTPITPEQASRFTDDDILSVSQQYDSDKNIANVYDALLKAWPQVFEPEVTRIQNALVTNYQLNEADLRKVSSRDLLWEEYNIYVANSSNENMGQLASVLHEKYHVAMAQSEVDAFKEQLAASGLVKIESLNKLDDNQLLPIMNIVGLPVSGSEELYRRYIVSSYPDAFDHNIQETVANEIRATVRNSIMDEALIQSISSKQWLQYFNSIKAVKEPNAMNLMLTAYDAVPEQFTITITNAKELLSSILTGKQLEQIQPRDILMDATRLKATNDSERVLEGIKSAYPQLFELQESKVNVNKKTGVESKQQVTTQKPRTTLPKTGEYSSVTFTIVAVVVLGFAGYFIYKGKKTED